MVRTDNYWRSMGKIGYDGAIMGRRSQGVEILARGPYAAHNLITNTVNSGQELPAVIDFAKKQRLRELQQAAEASGGKLFNGKNYGLRTYLITATPEPALHLGFAITDYFDSLIIDRGLNRKLNYGGRDASLRQHLFGEDTEVPRLSPYMANLFGIGCLIITSDNYALITKRSGETNVYRNAYSASIDESAAYPEDSDGKGGVDLVGMVQRGSREELAWDLRADEIRFLSLGHSLLYNQYFLLAIAKIAASRAEMHIHLCNTVAVDAWEKTEVHFVPWNLFDLGGFWQHTTLGWQLRFWKRCVISLDWRQLSAC